jgi:exodeoxyribonuclease III
MLYAICTPSNASTRSGTTSAPRWQRDAGLRIDHLLLSPNLRDRLADAGVDKDVRGREGASDHAPAWVRLS